MFKEGDKVLFKKNEQWVPAVVTWVSPGPSYLVLPDGEQVRYSVQPESLRKP